MRESFCKCEPYWIQLNDYFYFSFPREDDGSPRQAIMNQFCESNLGEFRSCMAANDFNENNCLESKGTLDKCAALAFKKVNSESQYIFWSIFKT